LLINKRVRQTYYKKNDNCGKKINIIFAPVSVSDGMAVNRRIKNIFNSIRKYINVSVENIVAPDEDIADLINNKYAKAVIMVQYIKKVIRYYEIYKKVLLRMNDSKNILYYSGGFGVFESIIFMCLRKAGCYVVIDILEDPRFYDRYNGVIPKIYKVINSYAINNVYRFVDGVVVISSHIEDYMNRLLISKKPLIKLPISIERSDYNKSYIRNEVDVVKIFYGGSYGNKDCVEDIIQVFDAITKNSNKKIKLILSGGLDVESKAIIDPLLSRLHNDHISFVGYLNDEEYLKVIHQCDILCVPRKNIPYACAGYPFKLGEYLATGNVVLSSAIKEVREMFSDDEVCFYDPDDKSDLYNKLNYLISNSQIREKIGNQGRIRAFDYFDADKHAVKFYEFINSL